MAKSAAGQAFLLIAVLAGSIWLANFLMGEAESRVLLAPAKNSAGSESDSGRLAAGADQAQVLSSVSAATGTVSAFGCAEDVSARAAEAEFLLNGKNIFQQNIEKSWPTASLMKLLFAVVVSENFDLSQEVAITQEAVAAEGTAGNFKAGEIFAGRDLLKAALLLSSNDAVEALAGKFGKEKIVALMKQKATDIGMPQTRIFEPTGLSWRNQSTTGDLTNLALALYLNYPEILALTAQKSADITELESGRKRTVFNINKFAGRRNFIGGKTGYIDEAQQNLLSIFDFNGRPAVVVVLGADDRFAETEKILKCISPTAF